MGQDPPSPPMPSELSDSTRDLFRIQALTPPLTAGYLAALGPYQITEVLGQGGMGVVLAGVTDNGDRVAIKVLHPSLRNEPLAVRRFLAEARIMKRLSHPCVLPIHEVTEQGDEPYYVMPLVHGGSLAERLAPGHALDRDETLRLARQIAEALAYAHVHGVIHRDLKPANILLTEAGDSQLSDFGLVRTVFNDSFVDPLASHREGTVHYMSPALARGEAEDTRCDIYSFGALLYEMLTGTPPYTGPSREAILLQILSRPPRPIRDLNPEADPNLTAVAEGAMARDLRDRYASMDDVVTDLNRIAQGQSPLGPRGRIRSRVRAHLLRAAFAAMAAMALFMVWNGWGSRERGRSDPTAPGAALVDGARTADVVLPQVALTVTRRIATLPGLKGVALRPPDENEVYACLWDTPEGADIQGFRTDTGEPVLNVDMPREDCHENLVLSSDGRYLYTSNYYPGEVSRFDLQTRDSTTGLPLESRVVAGEWCAGVSLTPDGAMLLAVCGKDGRTQDENNDKLALIDCREGQFEPVGEVVLPDEVSEPELAFTMEGTRAYVCCGRRRKSEHPQVHEIVVEGVSARLGRSLALPDSEPHSLVYAPGLDRLYVCDIRQKRVLVVDPGSLAVTGEFGVEGAKPSMVRLSPDEKILYVLSNAGCCLYAVDSRTHRIVGACTDLNPQPRKLTVGHEGKIYIAHAGEDGGLYVISPERRWITFCSDREGNYQIFRMALDGTNLTRLTHNRATELCPRWSPDGTRIAFVTDRAGPPHVAVMNEDGSDCRVLHETNPLSGRPDEVNSQLDWSPDGTRIVFCYSWDRVGVGIVELENGAVHDLLSLPAPGGQDWVSGVCWTQDGILASWHNSRADGGAQVIRISPQDGHTEVLLPKEPHCYPSQCPVTGRLLVFGQIPLDRPAPDLHIVAPGTDEAIPLLVRDVRDTAPCWTPDGKGVVFCSGTASARRAIWAMDSDGRNPRQLTTVESDNCQPDVKLWQ